MRLRARSLLAVTGLPSVPIRVRSAAHPLSETQLLALLVADVVLVQVLLVGVADRAGRRRLAALSAAAGFFDVLLPARGG